MGELRRSARQLWLVLVLLFALVAAAVFYYVAYESKHTGVEWTVVDGIYMAVLTVSTIGFGEVHPLSQRGELFQAIFAISGVLLMALAARAAASLVLGQQLSTEVQRRRGGALTWGRS